MSAARLGDLHLLVYRECPCGRWCATGEGAHAPKCVNCDGYFVPGGGPRRDERGPMFGADMDESMRLRRLSFVAFLTIEQGAVSMLARVRRFLGLITDDVLWIDRERVPDGDRLLTPNEAQAASDEIKENGQ